MKVSTPIIMLTDSITYLLITLLYFNLEEPVTVYKEKFF